MNTNMIGFRWFSRVNHCDLEERSLSIGRVNCAPNERLRLYQVLSVSLGPGNFLVADCRIYFACRTI